MGLLKQNRKLIIHPSDFDTKEYKIKPKIPTSNNNTSDDNLLIKTDNKTDDDIVNEFIIGKGNKTNYRDGLEYLQLEVRTIDDLEKFFDTVKGKRRIQIDPNRLAVKCPLCKINGKHTNIMAFTQNINEIECCGITYYK
jgi:hypothetical protein